MKGYNSIVIYSKDGKKLLMCRRKKEPYINLLNFVGGKIENGEDGYDAAYRELFEETAVTREDVKLTHFMDITYFASGFYLEVYVGKLNKDVSVYGDENELCWVDADRKKNNFFDSNIYAGNGNIGHILERAELCKDFFE